MALDLLPANRRIIFKALWDTGAVESIGDPINTRKLATVCNMNSQTVRKAGDDLAILGIVNRSHPRGFNNRSSQDNIPYLWSIKREIYEKITLTGLFPDMDLNSLNRNTQPELVVDNDAEDQDVDYFEKVAENN